MPFLLLGGLLAAAVVFGCPGAVRAANDPAATPELSAPGDAAAEIGRATWYASRFQGRRTASGERYDKNRYSGAHATLPFGTRVRVTSLDTGRSVVVTINDRRGAPHAGQGRTSDLVIDLSARAAREIGIVRAGVGPVSLTMVR
jgi:rare lipoprotein A